VIADPIHPPLKTAASPSRLAVLDGWRALSILSVLACHLLPLGPNRWGLNAAAGALGMVLFFNLSGFLITSMLWENPDWRSFLIRRCCRILPLALGVMLIALILQKAPGKSYPAHFLFYLNYTRLSTPLTSPLWSLCVEVHFYAFVTLLVLLTGKRGLYFLPLFCLGITAVRILTSTPISINTHLRIDEILAGANLALMTKIPRFEPLRKAIGAIPYPLILLGLLLGCHANFQTLNYIRPYLGSLLIANTLWHSRPSTAWLESKILKYFADVSYALYVIHPIMRMQPLTSPDKKILYLVCRPMGFAITFALAHLSTFYYEKYWINLGKKWTRALAERKKA
jgi:peptidoglycan/LPS O-acetylase OafA/YrhL